MFCRLFLCIVLFFGASLQAKPNELFSDQAWRRITTIYDATVKHPFNQELMKGTLSRERFAYYLEQDAFYLTAFSRSLQLLAVRLEDPLDRQRITQLAQESEQEKQVKEPFQASPSPATMLYTNYLLTTAAYKTKEELAAALLPCFWIYLRIAEELKPQMSVTNPYLNWAKTYTSPHYQQSVYIMLHLVNKLAHATTSDTRSKMLDSFILASLMEWYFWEAAYKMEAWRP